MFIGQFEYQIFTSGANDAIQNKQLQTYLNDEYRAETLKEVQRYFWDVFHKNKGTYHHYSFIRGQITDTNTNRTWRCDSYGKKTEGGLFMALPTYNKSKRRVNYEALPKDAYVVKILGAKIDTWPSGGQYLNIAFDIAEGKYAGFYQNQFDRNTNEDKKWPIDGTYALNVPADGDQDYVFTNWNTFFADLEDSNNGFIFDGDIKKLKGKLIGGKFHIKQTEYNGNVYDHTEMRYTCVAEDVRQGKAGKLPKDKLIGTTNRPAAASVSEMDGFVNLPDGSDEELPF